MAFRLDEIKFINPLNGGFVNWLLANAGDPLIIEHHISISEHVLASTQAPWIVNNTDGYIITPGRKWVTGGDFSKFNIGDNLSYYDFATLTVIGDNIVTDKLSNTEIEVQTIAGWTANDTATTTSFSLTNPITSLNYKWNWIENQEAANYFSKIDGFEHLASIENLNPDLGRTNLPMAFIGSSVCNQIGSIEVDEVSLELTPIYKSKFIIRHTTVITPIILAEQYDNLLAGISPDYFFNLNCLRSVFYYEGRYDLTNPNRLQYLEIDNVLGNSGLFNENWNTGKTNYNLSGLVYKKSSDLSIIDKAQLSLDKSTFNFDINNVIDAPFIAGSTKLIINFCKIPDSETEYQNNERNILHNFVWESALLTVQTTPSQVNGANYSDLSIRSLANLKATFVSSSKINISGKLDFDQLGIDIFEESNEPKYLFWVSIQNHLKTGAISDRANVLVDMSTFFYQSEFPNLIDFSPNLIPHDVNSYSAGNTNYIFEEDELVASTEIVISRDPLVESFEMSKVTFKILAESDLGENFVLESKTLDLPTNNLINGYQNFDIDLLTKFHIPSDEIRKHIVAKYTPTEISALLISASYTITNYDFYVKSIVDGNYEVLLPNDPIIGFSYKIEKLAGTSGWLDILSNIYIDNYTSIDGDSTYHYNLNPGDYVIFKYNGAKWEKVDFIDLTNHNYFFAYPFLVRWEYWKQLLNVNSYFFDTTKPNNGQNNQWVNYNNIAFPWNGGLKYEIDIHARVNGSPSVYSSSFSFTTLKRNLLIEYFPSSIQTFDAETLSELYFESKKYILGYKNTLVRATFSFSSSSGHVFDQSTTVVNMGIEIFEEGGVEDKRRMSSKYPSDTDTWFIPLSGENQTKLTFPLGRICVAETEIDFTKLNLGKLKWKLTARIYDPNSLGNYLKSQDVYLLPTNPITETVTPVELTSNVCGSDEVWNVLADENSNDVLKNDVNRFIRGYDKISFISAKVFLVECDNTEHDLTANTDYGTPYDFGFKENGLNQKLVGYEIEWKKVLEDLGEQAYRIRFDTETIFGQINSEFDDVYCLKQYTDFRAEGTVRAEYYISGILGLNNDDTKYKDLADLNWYNSHRFNGIFYYNESPYTTDEIQYQNGLRQSVSDSQEPSYTLDLMPIVYFKHDVFRTDIMMADQILITDYNSKNIQSYYKKNVRKDSSYTPIPHIKLSKLASVKLKFKQGYNNLNKFRS